MPLPASSGSSVFTLNFAFSCVPFVLSSSSNRTRNLVPGATAYVSKSSPWRSPSAFWRGGSDIGAVGSCVAACVGSCAVQVIPAVRIIAKTDMPPLAVGRFHHRPASLFRHFSSLGIALFRLFFEEAPNPAQDGRVHRGCDTASLRILLVWWEHAKQSWRAGRHFSLSAVRKFVECARGNRPVHLQNLEVSVPGNLPQRQDRFGFQNFQLALEVTTAIQDLFGERFILRRRAPAGRRDVCILQPQSVFAVQGSGLVRKACLVQRGIQKIP